MSSIFLKFAIDAAADLREKKSVSWLDEIVQRWRINAIVSDCGFYLDDGWNSTQLETVIELCQSATAAIRTRESIPEEEIQSWPILDDLRIFARGHDPVPCEPIARFGDAVIALLQGTLPKPPGQDWWLFTLDDETKVLPRRMPSVE